MQSDYWPMWEKFLAQWGLKPYICAFLDTGRPLATLIAQAMILAKPLAFGFSAGNHYSAIINLLDNEFEIDAFKNYLEEEQQ